MSSGIRDKVAIVGMGCSRFGERWEAGAEQLMVEAFEEALSDAGIAREAIGMAWLGTQKEEINVGKSAVPLSVALRLPNIAVTRVENYCATGTEAFRGAVFAVAAGACDFALALGVEKLKDTGYGGLPAAGSTAGSLLWQVLPNQTAPGSFAQLASGYAAKYDVDEGDLKRALAHVSAKSHENAVLNPKAHLRRAVSVETIINAPIVAYPLGLYDCCGVSDGAACAIVTTPEIACSLGKNDVVSVKAIQVAASNGEESSYTGWDVDHFVTTTQCAVRAYEEAGISDPRRDISMLEVHDCFSVTELITMEDLQLSDRGRAVFDVLDGDYARDGRTPCQPDGGLKCFGHPVGASGLRMLYEMYLQLQGLAGDRQVPAERYGLTHNLGGYPHSNVCSIAIVGRYGE